MTDKEKEAIKNVTKILNKKIDLKIYSHTDYKIINKAYKIYTDNDIRTVLNLIQTQQEEIERLKKTELKTKGGGIKVTLEGLLDIEKKMLELEAELEKKDKIIDEMASFIGAYELDEKISKTYCDGTLDNCKHKEDAGTCRACIKEYFINKVEKENKDDN